MHHHHEQYSKPLVDGDHHHGDHRRSAHHDHASHHHHGDDGSYLLHVHDGPDDHDHWTTHVDAWLHDDGAAYVFGSADHGHH